MKEQESWFVEVYDRENPKLVAILIGPLTPAQTERHRDVAMTLGTHPECRYGTRSRRVEPSS